MFVQLVYSIRQLQGRSVLSKIFVTVGVHDGRSRVALGQVLSTSLAIDLVVSATVLGEVGGFVDEGSSLSKEIAKSVTDHTHVYAA